MFTAEIIEDPVWSFAGNQVSVSVVVSIKNGEVVIETKPISVSISIQTENWKVKGYAFMIDKAKKELADYQANYDKVLVDTGFASPAEIITDLKIAINTALTEA